MRATRLLKVVLLIVVASAVVMVLCQCKTGDDGGGESGPPVITPGGIDGGTDGGSGGDSGDGGGSTPSSNSTGVFLDGAVQGLEFETPTISGITDAQGTFVYQKGETVSFMIGDISLGSATGAGVLTPVELVSGAKDETNTTVGNICRLLTSLDQDQVLDNGITIPTAAITKSEGVTLSFSNTSEFNTQLQTYIDSIFGAMSRAPVPLDTAQAHLKDTLLGLYAGTYQGTFSGDDHGSWSGILDTNGVMQGQGHSDDYNEEFEFSGLFTSAGSITMTASGSGVVTTGAEFTGSITKTGTMSGTWVNTDENLNGTFTGSKQ